MFPIPGFFLVDGGEKDTVAVSVSSKPAVTLQAKNLTSSGVYADETLEINKGDKIELKWSATDASSCKLYRLVGNKRANEALKETSGNLTINGLYDSAVYEMECFNTYVQDSATSICSSSKTEDTMIIKVSGEPPPPPTVTATSNCSNKKVEVTWTDTADTASNTATSKKNYYTFQRDSETSTTLYTNSYTDSDVSDGSSYDYKVNACNTNGCSKQSSVSATYSCSPDDDTVTPPPGGTVTPPPDNTVTPPPDDTVTTPPTSSSSSSNGGTVNPPPGNTVTPPPDDTVTTSPSSSSSVGAGASSKFCR